MTTIPSFAFPDLDAPHLDDKMDVASSPYRQANDIEIDLESVRDPSVLGDAHDEMIDEATMPADTGLDLMQDQFDETFADDDMYDDAKLDASEQHDIDYNMDAPIEELQGDEDEDILYEEEEETTTIHSQNNTAVESNDPQAPEDYHEADAEVILEKLGRQPEAHEPAPAASNESENFPVHGTDTGVYLAEYTDNPDYPHDQPLDTSQQPSKEQYEEKDTRQELTEQGNTLAENFEFPEHSASTEQPVEHQTDLGTVQGTLTATQPESAASANNEVPEELHEESKNSRETDDTTKTLHPVTVVYLEDEMSLFPPMLGDASSIYFLSDSSLASEPLDRLLAACRDILEGTLDHHDELVLDVPALGLHICEDSKYAAQITLAQVLDVYLRLCHNDEGQEVRPLYCHLSSRVSLASQYAYLASAGGEGKTYAEIAADHLDSPEPEDGNREAVDETEAQHDDVPSDGQVHRVQVHSADRKDTEHIQGDHDPDVPATGHQVPEEGGTELAVQPDLTNAAADVPGPYAEPSETLAGAEAYEQLGLHEGDYPQDIEHEYGHNLHQALEFAEVELDEDLNAADHPGDATVDGTHSSHTVEGDLADDALNTTTGQISGVENADFFEYNEQNEDLFQPDASTTEPEADYEPSGNEELFIAQDEGFEAVGQDDWLDSTEQDLSSTLQETNEQVLSQDVASLPSGKANTHSTSAAEALVSGNLSPPMTPKQGKQAKRKADDDDELLFLDLDTPDPKRRRP